MRKFNWTLLFILVLTGLCQDMLAQEAFPQPEAIYLHHDKTFYVAGENLWFQAYVGPSESVAQASRVLHWEIVDAAGESMAYRQLLLENGQASGDFFIPPDWPEGYYEMRAFTLWNLNFEPQVIARTTLSIFNLLEAPLGDSQMVYQEPSSPSELHQEGPYRIQLGLPTGIQGKRDSIPLAIEVVDEQGKPVQGQFSLKVIPESWPPLTERMASPERIQGFTARFAPQQTLQFQANLFDELFQRPLVSTFLSVYIVETQQFQFSTSEKGYLDVELPDVVGAVTLQLHDRSAKENYYPRIELLAATRFVKRNLPLPDVKPARTGVALDYLRACQSRREIEQLFEIPLVVEPPQSLTMQNNLQGDRTYVTADYIPFDNLESFVIEAMPTVWIEPILNEKLIRQLEEFEAEVAPEIIRSVDNPDNIAATQNFLKKVLPQFKDQLKDQKMLRLMEEETNQRFLGPPMYLIDNYITFDHEKIYLVPWRDVERVELFSLNRNLGNTFGPLGFNGVFSISTRRTEAPEVIRNDSHNMAYQGFYRPRSFAAGLPLREPRKPDLRGLVYWQPQILTNAQGKAQLMIPHGDDLGKFRVHLEGISASGQRVVAEARYEVQFSYP